MRHLIVVAVDRVSYAVLQEEGDEGVAAGGGGSMQGGPAPASCQRDKGSLGLHQVQGRTDRPRLRWSRQTAAPHLPDSGSSRGRLWPLRLPEGWPEAAAPFLLLLLGEAVRQAVSLKKR